MSRRFCDLSNPRPHRSTGAAALDVILVLVGVVLAAFAIWIAGQLLPTPGI